MKDKKEVNKNILNNYKKILTEKGKYWLIESDKYILHYSYKNANGDSIYHCKYYKNKDIKFKAFPKFDDNDKLISYDNQYSCIIDSMTIKKMF